jgi:hypothetical protein
MGNHNHTNHKTAEHDSKGLAREMAMPYQLVTPVNVLSIQGLGNTKYVIMYTT